MLVLGIGAGVALGSGLIVLLAWLLQERLAFPAPRAPVPDPRRLGMGNGEGIELVSGDGTRLAGWYLAPRAADALHRPAPPSPALLWFYGNGENIAGIWPILRDFQPPGTGLLVVDYPGYGGSEGRATEAGLYAAAGAAYAALAGRPGVAPRRIHGYGRSLGTAVASYPAARHPVAGLTLESPFTSAAAMARHLYPFLPRLGLRLSLDNLGHVRLVRCPVLLLHGTADRLAPTAMGMAVAAPAARPGGVVLVHRAGPNHTHEGGGRGDPGKGGAVVGRPQITTTGTIRARASSKRRSASSRVRRSVASSPSPNLALGASRPVSFRTATSARVTSQRSTSGSVWPATSSSSNSGRLSDSPRT